MITLCSALLYFFTRSLPDVRPLKDSQYTMTLMLKDADGKTVPFLVGQQNPHWTPLSNTPPALQWSVIVAEDDTFYRHNGFNFSAMRDAFWENIKKRKPVRGGSTITQQLAKNLYLSKKKSLLRKLKEAVITRRLERTLSKNRILELYVNIIEWGPGVYGVGEASWHYFRKIPSDLNFYESVLLAAIIPSPRLYNPRKYPERALERYRTVLELMYLSKRITLDQYEAACAVQLCEDPLDHALFICPLEEDHEEEEKEEGSRETTNSQELLI
ncbi:MAG: monofunctional biosynthetic peptidoglycan transglycosylase [Deltaproteobacteria bacterium]|nr:monofunctional biosynthetic peptidoglycan transglycosylase [Deltaproteobacteria bacterium]